MAEKIRILILAANPWDTNPLDLQEEYRRIQNLWENFDSQHEQFDIRYYPAIRGEELQEKVLKFKPHLIHFSGHGEADGLIFTNLAGDKSHEVSKQALSKLFELCEGLKAVFLNACYSANQAEEIVEQVDYVIGMNAAVDDLAAISFAEGFYTAIFSQDELNIEQAFKAGLAQMALVNIAESQQQIPTIQKRPKTYVPNCKHDIFISFADADAQWAKKLTEYLYNQLKHKLATFDGFQLYEGNDFSQLAQSATLLIIASPVYCQQYQSQLSQLKIQQPVFLVEHEICNRPDVLKGYIPHKFWQYDDNEGIKSVTGDSYYTKADELVLAIANRLIELKDQHLSLQNLDLQRQQQINIQEPHTQSINAIVFVNSAPEDLELTQCINSLLKQSGVKCVFTPKNQDKLSAKEIRSDIETKISGSDAVLVLCEKADVDWATQQIIKCLRLESKREMPLKIVAIHKGKDQPSDLGIDWDLLKIYACPPQQIEAYLQDFIGALL